MIVWGLAFLHPMLSLRPVPNLCYKRVCQNISLSVFQPHFSNELFHFCRKWMFLVDRKQPSDVGNPTATTTTRSSGKTVEAVNTNLRSLGCSIKDLNLRRIDLIRTTSTTPATEWRREFRQSYELRMFVHSCPAPSCAWNGPTATSSPATATTTTTTATTTAVSAFSRTHVASLWIAVSSTSPSTSHPTLRPG